MAFVSLARHYLSGVEKRKKRDWGRRRRELIYEKIGNYMNNTIYYLARIYSNFTLFSPSWKDRLDDEITFRDIAIVLMIPEYFII